MTSSVWTIREHAALYLVFHPHDNEFSLLSMSLLLYFMKRVGVTCFTMSMMNLPHGQDDNCRRPNFCVMALLPYLLHTGPLSWISPHEQLPLSSHKLDFCLAWTCMGYCHNDCELAICIYPVVSKVHHRHDGMQKYKTQHLNHRGNIVPYIGLIMGAGA